MRSTTSDNRNIRKGKSPGTHSTPKAAKRPVDAKTRVAVVLVLMAVAVWGAILVRQSFHSPADAHIDAGTELARRGDGLGAISEWKAATEADANNALAWQLLGQSYFEGHQWSSAAVAFRQVYRLQPNAPNVASLLAVCCLNLGDTGGALNFARQELKSHPNDVSALETVAAVDVRTGADTQELLQSLRKLTQLQPDKVEHLVTLAQQLISQNSPAEVVPVTDRILKLDPSQAEMYALRGIARFYSDGSQEGMRLSEADFSKALSLNSQQYASNLYLGRINKRRGKPEQAIAFLEQAVRVNPRKADAYYDLASTYAIIGQPAKSESARVQFQHIAREGERYVHLKKQADMAPGDFGLQVKAAQLAIQREEVPAARFYLERAEALKQDDSQVRAAVVQLASLSRTTSTPLPLTSPAAPAPASTGNPPR